MARFMTYERAIEYNKMLEKMENDDFCIPGPVIRHILESMDQNPYDEDIYEYIRRLDMFHDLVDPDEEEEKQLYYDYDYSHTLIPSIFKLYGFWKMKGGKSCNHLWNKEEGYLLAEIMWLLIEGDFQENIHFYHTKEKGWKKTTFKEAVNQLKYTERGKCYCKKFQHPSEYGDIIERYNGKVNLSEGWDEGIIHWAAN